MKGQYALPIVLLVMFLVVILYANYSTQTSASVYQTYLYKPNLAGDLTRYEKSLKEAFVESIYTGGTGQVNQVINKMQSDAEERGNTLDINCNSGHDNNKSLFWIYCAMNLSSGSDSATIKFNYTYIVPYEIRTFKDSNLSYETNYFLSGNTVYYRITGHNGDKINVTIYDPYNRTFKEENTSIGNWHRDLDFTPTFSGNWTIQVVNTTGGEAGENISKTIYVSTVDMKIKTYDNEGNAQTEFLPGENMNITVTINDLYGNALNCSVKASITNGDGKFAYQLQGQAENGVYSDIIHLSPWEPTGNATIVATEHCIYSQVETNVSIIAPLIGRFIEILPPKMKYNKPHSSVFGDSCGYSDWYPANETHYNIVPFYAENESSNDTLLVNQTTITVDIPNANVSWIHFTGSRGG